MEEIQFLEINAEKRTIAVPSDLLLGVLGDGNVERVYFRCPKIVGDNINLAEHQIYVKYVTAPDNSGERYDKKEPGIYHCQDVIDEGEYITFSWKLSGNVFEKEGFIAFSVLAADGEVTRWNTFPAIGTVLITIPGGLEEVAEKYPDIITQLLNRMDEVEEIATPEAMQRYVDTYLAEHPVELDETLTDNTKAAPAGVVGELKNSIGNLVSKKQGTENSGKALIVDENGNVICGEAGVSADATLSEEGKAADAKATGDAISELKEDLVNNVDEIRNNGFVRMRRINLFDNSSDKLTNGRIYSDGSIEGEGKTSDYIQIKPGRYIISSTNKYGVFCTNVYGPGKNILRTYTNYTTIIVLEDGDCYVRISCLDSLLQSIMLISFDDYYYYALLDGGSVKYYAYDDLVTDDVYPGFEKSHKLFEEAMEPLKAKNVEVFKDYGNINLLGKAIEGKYWHGSSFKYFTTNASWRCYPEIHLNLTAQGENYYVPVGNIFIDIWAIADTGIKKLGVISVAQYATGLRKFTISKTGVTEKYNSAGVKEADVEFDAEYDRVILLVSTRSEVAVLTKFEDITEYCDNSYKRVELSDTCKKYLINQIVSESTAFAEQIKSLTRPLYGKTLIVFGDSEMQYLTDSAENIDMYKNLLSIDTYKSYAIAGNTWEANEGDTNAETCTTGIHGQLNRLFSDISNGVIDKDNIGGIIWMMGTNGRNQGDFWETEGTSVNTDIACMCGAMNVFFNRILTNFTSTEIRLMGIIPIQGKGRNEYFGDKGLMVRHNLIRDAHRCWSIPFLDLQYEAEIPATTLLNCDNGTMGDVVHWSKLGMQIGIRKICGKLISV